MEGGGWGMGEWGMGIKKGTCKKKKKGTCYDEHWVLYVSDESLNSSPEILLYIN